MFNSGSIMLHCSPYGTKVEYVWSFIAFSSYPLSDLYAVKGIGGLGIGKTSDVYYNIMAIQIQI